LCFSFFKIDQDADGRIYSVYVRESSGFSGAASGAIGFRARNIGTPRMEPIAARLCVRAVFTAKGRLWQGFIGVQSGVNP
jgi:hypothetical protein